MSYLIDLVSLLCQTEIVTRPPDRKKGLYNAQT
jgi:hypothetical protein